MVRIGAIDVLKEAQVDVEDGLGRCRIPETTSSYVRPAQKSRQSCKAKEDNRWRPSAIWVKTSGHRISIREEASTGIGRTVELTAIPKTASYEK
jgi:hypothetical protein